MSDYTHKLVKCKECGKTISNCRCMSPNKTVVYEICDDCKKMDKTAMVKLSNEEIDKSLIDRDERKPVRKIMDDKIIPAAGSILAAGGAAAGAIANIQVKNTYKALP